MAGIRRDAPNPQKKRAATLTVLRELLAPIPDDFPGLRDRALLLVGFAGALRRSELAGILLGDLERTDQGYELTLKRTKGSQTEAVLVPLPYGKTELCPVRALARWLDAAAITDGPVFRRIWLPPRLPRAPPSPARDRNRAADAALHRPHRAGAAPPPRGSHHASSAATASNAAPSAPACKRARTPLSSSGSAATRALMCSESIWNSATCSRATRSVTSFDCSFGHAAHTFAALPHGPASRRTAVCEPLTPAPRRFRFGAPCGRRASVMLALNLLISCFGVKTLCDGLPLVLLTLASASSCKPLFRPR